MPETSFDLIVIGGGPGGYVGAIRAAQLGLKVACVEREELGGVCLNWGCIPTKALLAGASFYHHLTHHAQAWGITANDVSFDWNKVIGRSRDVSGRLNQGIGSLFKKHKITHFVGHAYIPSAGKVQVHDVDDTQRQSPAKHSLSAKNILIATGAQPRPLPGAAFDHDKIINARDAMTLKERPEKLLIVGAGAIGMEFAYFYHAFGTQVTVVEMLDRVLPIEDADVSKAVAKAYRKLGVTTLVAHKTLKLETTADGIQALVAPVKDESKTQTLQADKCLIAIGVQGRYDGLFDDSLGLTLFKDHIKVDYKAPGATYQTSVPGLYAIGDVIGPPWLAHVASEEAIVCVERLVGHTAPDIDYGQIPGCTYCEPQVASVGLTEQQCKDQNLDYQVGTFPLQASGKAQAIGETQGFVKLLTGQKHGEVLGAHMVGDHVTELIAEMGLAMKLEATVDEIIATIHAHPTLSEAVHEAALGTQGRMIHF